MSTEIKVPIFPESITEGTVAAWYKKVGEYAKRDEHLVDIETDKVVLEVVAPADGVLDKIIKDQGAAVKAQEVIGMFSEGEQSKEEEKKKEGEDKKGEVKTSEAKKEGEKPKESEKQKEIEKPKEGVKPEGSEKQKEKGESISPALRQLASETGVDLSRVKGTGEDGRITKEDIMKAAKEVKESGAKQDKEKVDEKQREDEKQKEAEAKKREPEKPKETEKPKTEEETTKRQEKSEAEKGEARPEKRVPMTRLRARIAERLLAAKNEAAILTTFNEVNMYPIMQLRNKYKDGFEKTYGVRLGFMSFFTLAVVEALKQFPIINASIDEHDIIYHGYYDIGIAVSTKRGLVVPILRDADKMTMAEIEKNIEELSKKAQEGRLSIEEITGGTFTISNGGVFGSLMSTPILNPPQSGILGMHKILERPVAENGQVVIRPMMYVALSYDHRLIDGSDSVRFLVTVKGLLEEPARLALGI